jgi:hypothetical protein
MSGLYMTGLVQVNIDNHLYACNKTFSFDINNGNEEKILGKYKKTVSNNENNENNENDENDETEYHPLKYKYLHYFKSDTNETTIVKSNFASLEESISNTVIHNDCLRYMSSCSREFHNKLLCLQNCEIFGSDELNGNLTIRADIANHCSDARNHFNDIGQEFGRFTEDCRSIGCPISGGKNHKLKRNNKTKKNKTKKNKTKKNKTKK